MEPLPGCPPLPTSLSEEERRQEKRREEIAYIRGLYWDITEFPLCQIYASPINLI